MTLILGGLRAPSLLLPFLLAIYIHPVHTSCRKRIQIVNPAGGLKIPATTNPRNFQTAYRTENPTVPFISLSLPPPSTLNRFTATRFLSLGLCRETQDTKNNNRKDKQKVVPVWGFRGQTQLSRVDCQLHPSLLLAPSRFLRLRNIRGGRHKAGPRCFFGVVAIQNVHSDWLTQRRL